jgi:CheY-like chemotaxis protein
MLKRFDYVTHHVEDGEDAVTYLQDHAPALILLDLNLPGMSGWDVLEHLVEIHGENTIPVIVTTAYSDSANRVIGKLQQVYKYLVKPFSPDELRDVVEEALARSSH